MIEYKSILIIIIVAIVVASALAGLSYILSVKTPNIEKVSAFECGFSPFADTRKQFEVRFFLVGILFIIFDLEISFLFPWSIVLMNIESYGYYTMVIFLGVLTVGLIYEWNRGGLDWE